MEISYLTLQLAPLASSGLFLLPASCEPGPSVRAPSTLQVVTGCASAPKLSSPPRDDGDARDHLAKKKTIVLHVLKHQIVSPAAQRTSAYAVSCFRLPRFETGSSSPRLSVPGAVCASPQPAVPTSPWPWVLGELIRSLKYRFLKTSNLPLIGPLF